MKKILGFVAFAALVAASGSAMALESATSEVAVGGTATNVCSVATGGTIGAGFSISNIISGDNVDLSKNFTSTNIGTVTCNYQAYVGLKSLNWGVTTGATAPSGFAKKVNYTASLSWGGQTASIDTSTSAPTDNKDVKQISAIASTGAALLSFTAATSADPLVVGTYADTLTVQVGATL